MNSAIHALRSIVGFDLPHSQVTDAELQVMSKYASEAGIIVELGCYEGKTTAELAKHTRGHVYSIDPFFGGRTGIAYGELVARTHCWKQGIKNVEFIKGFSYEVAPNFHSPIDLLFVDADHTFEAVVRDWEDWFPKVKTGGIIALHDSRCVACSPQYMGSMKFYEECVRSNPEVIVVEEIDSLAVLKVTR